jgi:hypothetical protein
MMIKIQLRQQWQITSIFCVKQQLFFENKSDLTRKRTLPHRILLIYPWDDRQVPLVVGTRLAAFL